MKPATATAEHKTPKLVENESRADILILGDMDTAARTLAGKLSGLPKSDNLNGDLRVIISQARTLQEKATVLVERMQDA